MVKGYCPASKYKQHMGCSNASQCYCVETGIWHRTLYRCARLTANRLKTHKNSLEISQRVVSIVVSMFVIRIVAIRRQAQFMSRWMDQWRGWTGIAWTAEVAFHLTRDFIKRTEALGNFCAWRVTGGRYETWITRVNWHQRTAELMGH